MPTIPDERRELGRSAAADPYPRDLRAAIDELEIAMPVPGDELAQDEEWIVANVDGEWQRMRLHDYGAVYAVQGLYEKWVYEVFQCGSPQKIRELLVAALRKARVDPRSLVVLDLGAGNGYVAGELRQAGVRRFVGVDIVPEAADAAERDRPGLYEDYVVGDLLDLDREGRAALDRHDFNCLACVAALGFGDIPPAVFAAAFNRVADGGWIAFSIKSDFLDERDESGFSRLIRRMLADGILELDRRESYTHRMSSDGERLVYEALIGRKRRDVPDALL